MHGEDVLVVRGRFFPMQSGGQGRGRGEGMGAELVSLCAGHRWMFIGWIHSHPTWEAFLSSVDMHLQRDIQRDVASAIALVLGKHGDVHSSRPTARGMPDIGSCSQRGCHEHESKDLLSDGGLRVGRHGRGHGGCPDTVRCHWGLTSHWHTTTS